MKCDCKVCNPEYNPFEQYLHWKRWTSQEEEDNWIGLTNIDMNTGSGYRQCWVESAVYSIKECEKTNPEWKILGDKEREEYWKKK